MKLRKFSVTNYKVFAKEFSVELLPTEEVEAVSEISDASFTILTGKNNMGKSTFLEAINEFYKETKAANRISEECFNNASENILFKAYLSIDSIDKTIWDGLLKEGKVVEETQGALELQITKKYEKDKNGAFEVFIAGEIASKPLAKIVTENIVKYQPYYIRPNMTTEEIDRTVSTLYSDAIESNSEDTTQKLKKINDIIQGVMDDLKGKTDKLLAEVGSNVSDVLNGLFAEQDLELKITGGEVAGFSIRDFIKNSDTKITVSSSTRKDMLLSEQGTGVQRMSLIYTIQKIIERGLGNLGGRMLLVDEPEAFLHPEAVRGLSRSLYEIGDSMPIIITTHSPILINLENSHTVIDIFRIDKNEGNAISLYNSKIPQFEEDDVANMKILNYVDSYVNEFFFSDKNIIVEGNTEKIVLNYIQSKYNSNFHVVEARGKTTICTLMKILNKFDAKYYVLHDVDNSGNFQPAALKAQRTNCKNIFDLKRNSKIYASESNFEVAFYGEKLSSADKTSRIFKILNEEQGEDNDIRNKILYTFNEIFELGIKEIKELEIEVCDKVKEVVDEEQIDNYFCELV
jgi:hypothetical protein